MTAESFRRFGVVLDPPALPGRTERLSLPATLRAAALPTLTLIHLAAGATTRSIDRMERHVLAGQAFLHLGGGGLLVVVAGTALDGGPDLSDVVAFATRGGQGFSYHPDVWHAGVSALGAPAVVASLLCCDGSAGDVDKRRLEQPVLVSIG